MFFMLTLGSSKNCCVAQKIVVSTKKQIIHIDVKVAHQNYVIHKKICCDNQKNYMAPKRRLMLTPKEDSKC